MHFLRCLFAVDVVEDVAALLLHPFIRGHDLSLIPRKAVVDLLVGIIVPAAQEETPLGLCVRYADQNKVDGLALVELHGRVEDDRFRGLSRRTVDEEMLLPRDILYEVSCPEIDSEEFGLQQSGILDILGERRG